MHSSYSHPIILVSGMLQQHVHSSYLHPIILASMIISMHTTYFCFIHWYSAPCPVRDQNCLLLQPVSQSRNRSRIRLLWLHSFFFSSRCFIVPSSSYVVWEMHHELFAKFCQIRSTPRRTRPRALGAPLGEQRTCPRWWRKKPVAAKSTSEAESFVLVTLVHSRSNGCLRNQDDHAFWDFSDLIFKNFFDSSQVVLSFRFVTFHFLL